MNLNGILGAELYSTAYQREQCRHTLIGLRLARARAQNELLDLCCELQKNPESLDPQRVSRMLADIRYLDSRAEQLERFLTISGSIDPEE